MNPPEIESDRPKEAFGAKSTRGLWLAMLATAAVLGSFPVRAYDLFWHVASGRWILDHQTIPDFDPFRFSSNNAPWVDHEWLFQVVVTIFDNLVGLTGLSILRTLVVVVLAVGLTRALLRTGALLPHVVPITILVLLGARARFFLRPEFFTFGLLIVLLALLQHLRRTGVDTKQWPTVIAILGLGVVWGNLHPGALAAPVIAGAFLVGSRLPGGWGEPRRGEAPQSWRIVFGLPVALAVAITANPYGPAIYTIPFRISGSLKDLPGVNPEWLPIWDVPLPSYFVAVTVLALLGGLTWYRTRRIDPATALAALALVALSATSLRHLALLFAGGAFFAAECFAQLASRSAATRDRTEQPLRDRRGRLIAFGICFAVTLWCVFPPTAGPLAPSQGIYRVGFGLEPDRFPEGAVDALETFEATGELGDIGPLYNNVAWGGYLLYRLYPPRQVFNEGRNEVNPDLLWQLAEARGSDQGWNELLERHGIDGAIVRYEDRLRPVLGPPATPGGRPVVEHRSPNALFFPLERFALVHFDDTGMLFIRRTPERAEALRELEYRFIHPEDRQFVQARAIRDRRYLAAAMLEIKRRLETGSPSDRAEEMAEELAEIWQQSQANRSVP